MISLSDYNKSARRKRWVFNFDLKASNDLESLTSNGNAFQSLGAAQVNDLSQSVTFTESICSTGDSGFRTFKPVFCIHNKLRLHAEVLS